MRGQALLLCALALVSSVIAGYGDPSQAPSICAQQGSDSILVAHEDCRKFYKCSEGKPAPLDCPSNLYYNIDKEYCDWPQNVDCGDRYIDKKEEGVADDNSNNVNQGEGDWVGSGNNYDDPAEAPKICAAEGSDGLLVAHEECRKFYKCLEGKPAALDCPINLLYNPEKEYCDWAENVQCGKRNVEDGPSGNAQEESNSKPSDASVICAAAGADGTLVAHEDCSKFYMCAEGSPVELSCPVNLKYNAEKQYCDWPQNVSC